MINAASRLLEVSAISGWVAKAPCPRQTLLHVIGGLKRCFASPITWSGCREAVSSAGACTCVRRHGTCCFGACSSGVGRPIPLRGLRLGSGRGYFIATLAPLFDAMNLNMRRFTQCGGKLLMYHGGADPLAPVGDSLAFVDSVRHEMVDVTFPAAAFDASMRLFVLPGVGHCRGGEGPDQFDRLHVLSDWVEKGLPADYLAVAAKSSVAQPDLLRPYNGSR
jgi:hypothetical protein